MKHKFDFAEVIKRAKYVLGVTEDIKIAKVLGLEAKAYSNRKKAGSIPFEPLIDIMLDNKVDLRWLFTGEEDNQALRDAIVAVNAVGMRYSAISASLQQDMHDAALAEHLNATQLIERFKPRLPHPPLDDEISLLDHYRAGGDDDKKALLHCAEATAKAAKQGMMRAIEAEGEKEKFLLSAYRAASQPQREAILSAAQHRAGYDNTRQPEHKDGG